MNKILMIVAHPNKEDSRINKKWTEAFRNKENITVHELYKEYPDEKINVEKEQKLVEQHDTIIFQFPFYWYSSPPLLKKWQDEVLTYGWAYGRDGTKLHGKSFMLAISTGSSDTAYRAGGKNEFSINELTKPFQAMNNLVGMKYLPSFVFHDLNNISDHDVEKSIPAYLAHIREFCEGGILA
ncbi:putative NADPH-quinone reductase [Bacillus ectoiniformans]|uniref:NAD(P)H-dependent oxidoreductase n=1 Tax=Bacillus ectoiniformans TaxID=1494429 RepID=UPI00195DB301|nr:NAD(P)H-dependent oxidoreductase [Bacillus ectoiniformans]MBM7649793.1 putative NADPH-quinone reductase [Bacillus ectoiniformans]